MPERERLLCMMLPTKQSRRTRFLKDQAAEFAAGDRDRHFSPSGMTAILFAEAALAKGLPVVLKIHPLYGVVLYLDDPEEWPSPGE